MYFSYLYQNIIVKIRSNSIKSFPFVLVWVCLEADLETKIQYN